MSIESKVINGFANIIYVSMIVFVTVTILGLGFELIGFEINEKKSIGIHLIVMTLGSIFWFSKRLVDKILGKK